MNLYGDKILDSDVILNIKENVTGSNIRLIVIDTLSSSMNIQNENDNSEFNKAIDVFRKLIASVDGVSMVLIHHIGKESKGGVYAGRGASSLSCAASCTVNISREINGTQNIEIAKIRTDGEEEIQHQYSYLATGGKWNAQSDEHKSKAKSTTTKPRLSMSDKKKLILDHIEKNPGSSQKQIAEGVQMSEPTVSLVLKEFGVNELKLITDGKTKTFYAL
jgi:RecA-family ATPase